MPSVVFAGSKVKALKDRMSLNDVTEIISVNADPSTGAGVAAPLGSIAMDYLAGKVYKKTGSLATEWQELGSGIGGINYIKNPDAESGTTGWSTYADAAGSAPVDGTGGSANITWSRSTTTPLRGVADFNLVKDAVNRQGQGVSYSFTIDSADQAKILTISADFEVISGTYATGDLAVYIIQDPAGTPVVIQPAGYQIESATIGNKLRLAATFQTASNVTSYRLCIHVASTSASAYTLAFDSIAVSPQQVVYGAPVTDWQAYTPTFGGVTATSVDVKYRRVGDSIEVVGKFDTSASAASVFTISLPSGLSIDTAKIPSDRTGTLGFLVRAQSTVQTYPAVSFGPWAVTYSSAAGSGVVTVAQSVQDTGGFIYTPTNGSTLFSAGDPGTFEFRVPILGWSSSVVVSSSTDTRVVAAKYYVSSTSAPGANLQINFDTKISDTHGAVTTGSGWKFTAPVAGTYAVAIHTQQDTATNYGVRVYKNGSLHEILYYSGGGGLTASGSTLIDLVAGDYIDARPDAAGGIRGAAGPAYLSAISISRLSGPSQIAASETVAARYEATGNRTPTSVKSVNYDTRVFDTHGAVTTVSGDVAGWKFTAPISGKYSVSVSNWGNTATVSTMQLCKNGTLYAWLSSNNIANVAQISTAIVDVVAGDFIDIRADGTPTCVNITAKILSVSIHRIGN